MPENIITPTVKISQSQLSGSPIRKKLGGRQSSTRTLSVEEDEDTTSEGDFFCNKEGFRLEKEILMTEESDKGIEALYKQNNNLKIVMCK